MKSLKSILIEKFTYLALGIFLVILCLIYINLTSTLSNYKKSSTEITKVLADYFEPSLHFDFPEDFEKLSSELDFENIYHSVSIYTAEGDLFASKGDVIKPFQGKNVIFKNNKIYSRADIVNEEGKIGTLFISFYATNLVKDMIISIFVLAIMILFVIVGFYFYIKELTELIVAPITRLVKVLFNVKGRDWDVFDEVNTQVSEISELKENFANLILQLNFSKVQLELTNENLEKTVNRKTSELKLALEKTKKFQKQLVAQEKLASLGGLSAGIAHEIKNPLNLIMNSALLINSKVNELEELISKIKTSKKNKEEFDSLVESTHEICEIINSSSERADMIIKSMLSQARPKSSKKEDQDLTQICRQALNLGYHSMRARPDNISVKMIEDIQEGVTYHCYFEEIERVIINLMENSFDALKEKKSNFPNFEPVFRFELKTIQDKIKILVEDNGIGIPVENMEKIREPFFTTKDAGKGTGLGLSMIHDIVISQGGELIIESKIGEFSRFVIIFSKEGKQKKAG